MAVPVELSRVIFEAILKTFAGIPYEYVKNSINLDEVEQLKLELGE
jgi:hypothetical protein